MSIPGYFTTKEAAHLLGLSHDTVRGAVRRGTLRAERLGRLNLIPTAEVERYLREVKGTRGWEMRKSPGYVQRSDRHEYHGTYRAGKRRSDQQDTEAAHKPQASAAQPEED